MKCRLKVFVLMFLALLILCAGLLFFYPASVVIPVANFYLDATGIRITGVRSLRIGSSSSQASSVTLAGNGLLISIDELGLDYRFGRLLAGQLDSVDIARLSIQQLPANQSGEFDSAAPGDPEATDSPGLSARLDVLDRLPISEISIAALLSEFGDRQISTQLAVSSNPVTVTGTTFSTAQPELRMDFDARRSGASAITGRAILRATNSVILETEFDLEFLQRSLAINADSTVYLNEILKLPGLADLPGANIRLSDSLDLNSSLILDSPFSAFTIKELTLTLDNPDSLLQLVQQTDTGRAELQLQLPLQIFGESAALNSDWELSIPVLQVTGSGSNQGVDIVAVSTFTDLGVSCSSMSACRASFELDSKLMTWEFDEFVGQDLGLNGSANLIYGNTELRLSAVSLELIAPVMRTAGIDASATVQLENLNLRLGNSFDLDFAFSSTHISPGIDALSFPQLSAAGRFELHDGSLTTLIEIELNEQLKIGAAIQHYFFRDTGDVEIKLAPYDFATAAPLSALLEQSVVNGDIVAGKIEGQGNISWSQQSDRSWQFGGPVRFSMQDISGFYDDLFFVDLNSELFAEVTTPLGLLSVGSQRATIASVDVGLPVQNIEWQYRFDTAGDRFNIDDASAELLGGNIAIPEFEYRADRDQNELAVVIDNLDLASIVELADYPGLVVEGRISGYLPLQLRGDIILIEAGLVAALQPGGAIQYTPANPIPSSNPSIQLVNDALSNYQFTTMNTDVFYDEIGDLRLVVQLRGTNPDMNNGQGINLNVNITDNIPTLMRSLQASRIITDALEQSLGNQ